MGSYFNSLLERKINMDKMQYQIDMMNNVPDQHHDETPVKLTDGRNTPFLEEFQSGIPIEGHITVIPHGEPVEVAFEVVIENGMFGVNVLAANSPSGRQFIVDISP